MIRWCCNTDKDTDCFQGVLTMQHLQSRKRKKEEIDIQVVEPSQENIWKVTLNRHLIASGMIVFKTCCWRLFILWNLRKGMPSSVQNLLCPRNIIYSFCIWQMSSPGPKPKHCQLGKKEHCQMDFHIDCFWAHLSKCFQPVYVCSCSLSTAEKLKWVRGAAKKKNRFFLGDLSQICLPTHPHLGTFMLKNSGW